MWLVEAGELEKEAKTDEGKLDVMAGEVVCG